MSYSPGPYLANQFRRHLSSGLRRPGDLLNPVVFFLMVVTLFPLGLGPAPDQLASLSPGLFWVVALLSNLTNSSRLFAADYEDGSLEQLVISPHSTTFAALTEVGAHWLFSGVILAIVSPVFAVMLNMPSGAIATLVISLLLGTLVLSLIGAIGAALTVGLHRGGMLLSLLIIPLYVPVLIFGVGAVTEAALGRDASAWLALLGALAAGGLILAPIAIGAALKVAVDR